MAVKKFPPPPTLPRELGPFGQQLNRWLIEIQNILNAGGTINPEDVEGLVAAYAELAALVIEVAAIEVHLTTIDGEITTINTHLATIDTHLATIDTHLATIDTHLATIDGRLAALEARNQVLNGAGVPGGGTGNNGDLYINNTGGAGTNLYAKIGGIWVAFA